jgi:hypothetical protein
MTMKLLAEGLVCVGFLVLEKVSHIFDAFGKFASVAAPALKRACRHVQAAQPVADWWAH